MKVFKTYKQFILEQDGLDLSAEINAAPIKPIKPVIIPPDPPADNTLAVDTISEEDFNKKVAVLDGFALYFSSKVQTLVKYDETSMSDCDGYFDDDEGCYWKVVWRNWEAEGVPTAYVKFVKAVEEFNKLVTDKKVPNEELAKQIQYRITHNLHEANRMNQGKLNKLSSVAKAGMRRDTLRGMVMKVINTDDHWFRWTMYYTNTSVTPYGGGQPTTVQNTETYKVDCDF